MSAFLFFDPNGSRKKEYYSFFPEFINRCKYVEKKVDHLVSLGWKVELVYDGGLTVICRHPDAATEDEVCELALKHGIDLPEEEFAFTGLDEDFEDEDMCGGDVSLDDYESS